MDGTRYFMLPCMDALTIQVRTNNNYLPLSYYDIIQSNVRSAAFNVVATYPYLRSSPGADCKNTYAFGWIGAGILFSIAVIGAYVIPTVLIGIISIKFDESSRYLERQILIRSETERVINETKVNTIFIISNYVHAPIFFLYARPRW